MKLEIEKERVLAAAKKCSIAKGVLSEIFPEVFKEGQLFKIGDIFSIESAPELQEFYMLSQTEAYKVALVNLREGNRYEDPIKVKDVAHITLEELKQITGIAEDPDDILEEEVKTVCLIKGNLMFNPHNPEAIKIHL